MMLPLPGRRNELPSPTDGSRPKRQLYGEAEQTPSGKAKGLSLSDPQSPAEPAAYLTEWHLFG
jgi:hypothetical protein